MPEFADASDLTKLERVFERIPDEAKNEVRKVNRAASYELRNAIRIAVPTTGGTVEHRHSGSRQRGSSSRKNRRGHDTKSGAMRRAVRAFAGYNYAGVRAGKTGGAPHFTVNEFGGAVWWSKGGGLQRSMRQRSHRSATQMRSRMGGNIGHIIPVRERSPMNHIKTWQSSNNGMPVTKSKAFPSGWYFYKTAAEHMPRVLVAHAHEMQALTRRLFNKV